MTGRKPQNQKLLELRGGRPNRGKHYVDVAPLSAEPGELTGQDAELFRRLVNDAPRGLFGAIDRCLVTVFCQHVGIHRRAVAELESLTMETPAGPRKHALVRIADDQVKVLRARPALANYSPLN